MNRLLRSIREALQEHPHLYKRYLQSYQQNIERIKSIPQVQQFIVEHEIKDEDLDHNLANFRQWVLEVESCERCTGYDTCPNLYQGHVITPQVEEGELIFAWQPCQKYVQHLRRERQKKLLKSHYIPKEIMYANFDRLDKDKGNIDAIKAATLFCLHFREAKGKGLYFYGEFGVGKTYIMGAIANKLTEEGYSVCFVHVPTFFREIKASIQDNSYMEKIAELEKVDCLILDDIGAESLSPWLRDEVLGSLIQYRTQNEKPILYTSNLDYDHLREHLAESSRSQIDELKAFRIAERIRSYTDAYKLLGENRRRK